MQPQLPLPVGGEARRQRLRAAHGQPSGGAAGQVEANDGGGGPVEHRGDDASFLEPVQHDKQRFVQELLGEQEAFFDVLRAQDRADRQLRHLGDL